MTVSYRDASHTQHNSAAALPALSRTARRRHGRTLLSIGASAQVIASVAAAAFFVTPSAPAHAQEAVVSACTGVSLPRSVVTDIASQILVPVITPIQNLLGTLTFGIVNLGLAGAVSNAAAGQPISLQAVDISGNAINVLANPNCVTQADSFQLETQGGIAFGGNRLTGLGLNGQFAVAGADTAIAIGNNASTLANAQGAIAIGNGATVTHNSASVALGSNSSATGAGLATAAYLVGGTAAAEVNIGTRRLTGLAAGAADTDAVNVAQLKASAAAGLSFDLGLGAYSALRGGVAQRITNVAAGTLSGTSTDAVNGTQLNATNTLVAGNTTAITNLGTTVAGHTTNLATLNTTVAGHTTNLGTLNTNVAANTTNITNLGTALTAVTDDVTALQADALQFDGGLTAYSATRGGVATQVTGVAAGTLSATSTDAVNGTQLNATNALVAGNTTNITNLGNSLTALAADALQFDAGLTAYTATRGGVATQITGVAAGTLSATSTDAVNGAQLNATNALVAGNTTNITNLGNSLTALAADALQFDAGLTAYTATRGGVATQITGVAAGTLGATSTDAVNGAQLDATNTLVAGNTTAITNLGATVGGHTTNLATLNATVATQGTSILGNTTAIANLDIDLDALDALAVKYDGATKDVLTLEGGDGTRITNLAAGTLSPTSTDAVNGSQLDATNQAVAGNTTSITNLGTALTGVTTDVTALQNDALLFNSGLGAYSATRAGVATKVTGVAAGTLSATSTDAVNGTQLNATNTQVASNTTNIAGNTTSITNLTTDLNALGALAVSYDSATKDLLTLEGGDGTRITNVAAGTVSATSTDAVNGSQLDATNQAVAGNTTSITNLGTTVAGNTTAINTLNTTVAGNGTAITALQNDALLFNSGLGAYSATRAGVATKVTGVAAGTLSATSTDAVNGTQLNATNTQVASNTTNIAGNTTSITNLTTDLNALGALAVSYDSASKDVLTLEGGDGTRITNVAAGTVSATSTDAVNGTQLNATNQLVAGNGTAITALQNDALQFNAGLGAYSATRAGVSTKITGVAAGTLSATSTDAVNGTQLNATNTAVAGNTTSITTLNTNVAGNTTAITNLTTNLNALGALAVSYDSATKDLLTLEGGDGTRVTNVTAGTLSANSTDAVNGSQLNATNQAVAGNTTSISNLGTALTGVTTSVTALQNDALQFNTGLGAYSATRAGVATKVTGVAAGTLSATSTDAINGTQLNATNTAVAGNTTNIAGNTTAITNLTTNLNALGALAVSYDSATKDLLTLEGGDGTRITNVAAGTVSATSTDAVNGSQLNATNTAVAGNTTSITNLGTTVAGNTTAINTLNTTVAGNTTAVTALQNDALQFNAGLGAYSATRAGLATKVTGVAAGTLSTTSTDAVNGAQLNATNLSIANLSTTIGTADALSAKYDTITKDVLTLQGATGTRLTNVTAGTLSATSTDAVNGSQLNTTNQAVAGNTTSITNLGTTVAGNTTAINTLNTTVAGNSTAVTALQNDALLFNSGLGAYSATRAGVATKVTGVAAGTLSATSTDAINGTQLNATNTQVASNTTNIAGNTTAITNLTTNLGTLGALAVSYDSATKDLLTLDGTDGTRITNVAAGTLSATSTDAVNGSQLDATNQAVAGNTTSITNLGTTVAGNTTAINTLNTTVASNSTAVTALQNDALLFNSGLGAYSATRGGVATKVTGVAAGTLSATSTDAVNGSQLFATNQAVTTNTTAITNLQNSVIGSAVSPIQYSNAATPTAPNGGTLTNDVTLIGANAAAPVALHNVAAGTIAAGSTDAVNGGQLNTTNQAVAGNTTSITNLGATVAGNTTAINTLNTTVAGNTGAVTALQNNALLFDSGLGAYSATRAGVATKVTGVAAGTLSATSTDAVNGTQLNATNTQVASNTTNIAGNTTAITNLTTNLGTLGALAVSYDSAAKDLLTLDGAAGTRISNVAAGTLSATSTDAVNGSQLDATNQAVAGNTTSITNFGTALTGVTNDVSALQGNALLFNSGLGAYSATRAGVATKVTGVAAGTLSATSTDAVNGAQLNATNTSIANLSTSIGAADALSAKYDSTAKDVLTLQGATGTRLTNVTAGTLSATSTDAVNGAQLDATNQAVAGNTTSITNLGTTVTNNTTAINTLNTTVAGNIGAVTALQNDALLFNEGLGAYSASRGGAAQRITNLADGTLSAGSSDAVTGGQLYATNQAVAGNTTSITNLGNSITNLGSGIGDLQANALLFNSGLNAYSALRGGTAQIVTGVAAGTLSATSTDAVNGAQLDVTNQAVASNASSITNITNNLGAIDATSVRYDDASKASLTLAGANGTRIGNVAAGALSATSSDAVNGSQLFATNQAVTTNTTDIAQTNLTVTNLTNSVSNGDLGPLRYSSVGMPTVPSGTGPSNDVTLFGASGGAVGLHNVAAGILSAASTDAVNGAQIFGFGTSIANAIGGTSSFNPATGTLTTGLQFAGGTYGNVQSVVTAIETALDTGEVTNPDGDIRYFRTTSVAADSQALGTDSTAIGPNAIASADGAFAAGRNTQAQSEGSVAIGDGAMATAGKAVSIGSGNMAAGDGAVAIGDPNFAVGDGAVALGRDNQATGDGAVALGDTNFATGIGAVGIGANNNAVGMGAIAIGYANALNGDNTIVIGDNNVVTGAQALTIGSNNSVTGDGSLAFGSNVMTAGIDTLAIGNDSSALGDSATAYGNRAAATGFHSTALGTDSIATDYGIAVGETATASGFAATAVGTEAVASGFGSVAIGAGSRAGAYSSVALGGASDTARGGVASYSAFGVTGAQSSIGEVAIAASIVYIDPATGLPALTGNRQLTGLAAGSAATDAVNVAQLQGVSGNLGAAIAAGLGGGASYNALTGTVSAPTYTVNGASYGNVGDAIAGLTGTVNAAAATGVTYDGPAKDSVTLAGASGTTISNVAAGTLAAGSTQAVNGSQLFATNQAVSANTTAITNLQNSVVGSTVSPIQYSNAATPTMSNGGTLTNDVTLIGANAAAPVGLHNVAAGTIAAGSTDAVNGGQVHAIATAAANSVQYGTNADGTRSNTLALSGGNAAAPVTITNVAAGAVNAGSTQAVNGGQLSAVTTIAQTALTTADEALELGQNSVQYDADGSVTLGAAVGTPVALRNVAAGVSGTDAINLTQLNTGIDRAISSANAYTDTRFGQLEFDLGTVRSDANAGTAAAMAMSTIPQAYGPGMGMAGMGVSTWRGESAIAFGISKATAEGGVVVKAGATYNTRGHGGAAAGVGLAF